MSKIKTFFKQLFCWHDWDEDDPFTYRVTCCKCGKKENHLFSAGRIPKPPRRARMLWEGGLDNVTPPATNEPLRFDQENLREQQETPLDRLVRAFNTPYYPEGEPLLGSIRIDEHGVARVWNGTAWVLSGSGNVPAVTRDYVVEARDESGNVVARVRYNDEGYRTSVLPPAPFSSGMYSSTVDSVDVDRLARERLDRVSNLLSRPWSTQDAPPHTPVEPPKPLKSRIRLDE